MAETWMDPYRAYNFKVEVQGSTEGHFTECSGLEVKVNTIAYREGGSPDVHQLPGPIDYGSVTLRYGLTASSDLWNWFKQVMAGRVERRNVSIAMLDTDARTEVLRWNLTRAWPSHWRGMPLDAAAHEVAIETLTLVFESVDRA
jgi:phage tail-like protein